LNAHPGGDEGANELQAARQRAVKLQAQYDAAGARAEAERAVRMAPAQKDRGGTFAFTRLLNAAGQTNGWRVDVDGKISGLIVPRDDRTEVIVASNDGGEDNPTADQLMVAFLAGPGKEG